MPGTTSSVKALAVFLLLVGGATSVFLSIALSFNYLFALFGVVSTADRILGYAVLAGPIPLVVGAVLTLSRTNQKSGVRLALLGSAIVTAWAIIFYVKSVLVGLVPWEKLLWFVLVPAAVVATDMVAYRIHKLISASSSTAAK